MTDRRDHGASRATSVPDMGTWLANPGPMPGMERRPRSFLADADALIGEQSIGVAVGIVAVQRQQTPHEALTTLAGIAQRTDRSVVEVAAHLVARHSRSGRVVLQADRTWGRNVDSVA